MIQAFYQLGLSVVGGVPIFIFYGKVGAQECYKGMSVSLVFTQNTAHPTIFNHFLASTKCTTSPKIFNRLSFIQLYTISHTLFQLAVKMYSTLIISTFAALALAAPRPQLINLDAVDAAPDPVFVTPSYDVVTENPTVSRRDARIQRRDGTCAQQPDGYGPATTPDTVDAFSSSSALQVILSSADRALDTKYLQAMATNAVTPDGYVSVFTNIQASLSASNYMGLHTLQSYDTLGCASLCDQVSGCQAFNLYIERDPSVDPNAQNCPSPPSITNYKCSLWGTPVSVDEAVNQGQWRDSFQVVITASNGYNKDTPPDACDGFTGPTEFGGAINAPLDSNGANTYLGYKYFPFSQTQGYTPSTCASACTSQTGYNSRHPASDGTYQTCAFFNAYVLSENGIPQGLYCSLYNETWAPSYATNYGQSRGNDRYTVSRSYGYSLS